MGVPFFAKEGIAHLVLPGGKAMRYVHPEIKDVAALVRTQLQQREAAQLTAQWEENSVRKGAKLLILMAAPQGFEPRYADPESAVLPLNEGATLPRKADGGLVGLPDERLDMMCQPVHHTKISG